MSSTPMSPDDYATDETTEKGTVPFSPASPSERVMQLTRIATPRNVTPRFALRVSGARVGDAARPCVTGPGAAGSPSAPSDPYAMPRRTPRGTQVPPVGGANVLPVGGAPAAVATAPASAPSAATPRPPRFGLRVHARFGVVPEVVVASDDEGGVA